MKPNRGIVMELQKRRCIVLTSDGRFLKIPLPRGGAEVGQEVTLNKPVLAGFKPLLAVASLLVAVLAWLAFDMMIPRAAAYIALDINPSIELGVNGQKEIISARGIDREGEELLGKVSVLHEPLKEGLEKIITGAIEYNYLSPGKNSIVLATITETSDGKVSIPSAEIYNTIYTPIHNNKINSQLIVTEADGQTWKKARQNGITPGRYLLREEAQKKGITITREELKDLNILELEKTKHFQTKKLLTKEVDANTTKKPADMKLFIPGERSKNNEEQRNMERNENVKKLNKEKELNYESNKKVPNCSIERVGDNKISKETTKENNNLNSKTGYAGSPSKKDFHGAQRSSFATPSFMKDEQLTGRH